MAQPTPIETGWTDFCRRNWRRIWFLGIASSVAMVFHRSLPPSFISSHAMQWLGFPWLLSGPILCTIGLRYSEGDDSVSTARAVFSAVVLVVCLTATLLLGFESL